MRHDDSFNPKRKEGSDKFLKYLPIITDTMRESQRRYTHNQIDEVTFMNSCQDELTRVKQQQDWDAGKVPWTHEKKLQTN
jgi:hypothetical protein